MIFIRRQPASLFHSFFVNSTPEAYIFPCIAQEKIAGNEKTEASNSNKVATTDGADKVVRNGSYVNVVENDNAWVVYMDMPGVKAENVEIEEKEGTLKVEAKRKTGDKVMATYQQHFALDSSVADASKLSAELIDGVLTITLPKKPKPDPIKVQVVSADAPDIPEDASKEFRYTFDLPGVKASDVRLEFQDDTLHLQAERKKGGYTTNVERMFTVARSVDMGRARAYLMDGIFTLVAPRMEALKPETHKITLGENTAPKAKL